MKTTLINSGKIDFGRAILLLALVFVLGSTGCQKADELLPSAGKAISQIGASPTAGDKSVSLVDETATNSNTGALAATKAFDVIIINHRAILSLLPDYSVTVRSDGMVIYEGRKNVRVEGRSTFRVADVTMPVLHEIFDQYRFYEIVPGFDIYLDMPLVFTTYQPNQFIRPMTIYDDYNSNPHKLILIRKSVESLLGIDRFVRGSGPTVPADQQEPLF